jgi:adenine-specific DNA-methyltransferase
VHPRTVQILHSTGWWGETFTSPRAHALVHERLFDVEALLAPALRTDASAVDREANRRLIESRVARYPRIRFMGSKYKLAGPLSEIFAALPPGRAVDAFSGSGVVAYVLKATGRQVLASDHLAFASTLTEAIVANNTAKLSEPEINWLCSPNSDGRDFISRTFEGLYFPVEDHAFLDAAWSHVDELQGPKRALAISALCLAAARKQPRGVFTVTTPRYDDGRRQMHMSLEALFREAAQHLNDAVFATAAPISESACRDVFDIDARNIAVAYLDPPYAPPKDDTCYIKRYHFLEGLATYWRGQEIMWNTKTRKLRKRQTPFAYKRTAGAALDRLFDHFRSSALVVSYGSNAALDAEALEVILKRHKRFVRRIEIAHRYAFGTHASASRREATEYVFVAT